MLSCRDVRWGQSATPRVKLNTSPTAEQTDCLVLRAHAALDKQILCYPPRARTCSCICFRQRIHLWRIYFYFGRAVPSQFCAQITACPPSKKTLSLMDAFFPGRVIHSSRPDRSESNPGTCTGIKKHGAQYTSLTLKPTLHVVDPIMTKIPIEETFN